MNRTFARPVLGIELRRTLLPATALAVIGIGAMITGPMATPAANLVWSSSWSAAGGWLSSTSLALGPLAGATGAWVAGRERRRHLGELLAATSRPVSQRLLMAWAAIAVAVLAGFAATAAIAAASIAPAVSYAGGRWALTWALVLLGLLACSAIGFAVGRLVPGRLAAPLVGVGLFLWGGFAIGGEWYNHLAPIGQLESEDGSRLAGPFVLPVLIWLLALTGTALILATARKRRWAGAGGAIALAALLFLEDSHGGMDRIWYEPDPSAVAQVCTPDVPRVCVLRVHAGYLSVVTPVARRTLLAAQKYIPVTQIVENDPYVVGQPDPPDTMSFSLFGESLPFRGALADVDLIRQTSGWYIDPQCAGLEAAESGPWPPVAIGVAARIITELPQMPDTGYPIADPATADALYTRVTSSDAARTAWMKSYLRAAEKCDIAALTSLAKK